jgi:hypothetical protein
MKKSKRRRRLEKQIEREIKKRLHLWCDLAQEVHLLRAIVRTPSDGSTSRAQCEARLPLALAEKIEAQRAVDAVMGRDCLRDWGLQHAKTPYDMETFLEIYEPEGGLQ